MAIDHYAIANGMATLVRQTDSVDQREVKYTAKENIVADLHHVIELIEEGWIETEEQLKKYLELIPGTFGSGLWREHLEREFDATELE